MDKKSYEPSHSMQGWSEETQLLHWRINLRFLLIAMLLILAFIQEFVIDIPFGAKPASNIVLLIILLIIISIPLLFGRMTTTVSEKEVCIRFGHLGWIKKRIPLANIKDAEVVTFDPLLPLIQFDGWGG